MYLYIVIMPKRINEVFDFYILNDNINVINMLNTKYIIAEEQGQVFPYVNEDANGNAYYVYEPFIPNTDLSVQFAEERELIENLTLKGELK